MFWRSKFFCLLLAKIFNDFTIVLFGQFPTNQVLPSAVINAVLYQVCQLPKFKTKQTPDHPYRFLAKLVGTLLFYDACYWSFHCLLHESDFLYDNVHYFHHEKLPPLNPYYTLHVHFFEVVCVTAFQIALAWFGDYYSNNLVLPLVQIHSVLIHSEYDPKFLLLGAPEHAQHHLGREYYSLFFNFELRNPTK